jgi:uncharacterized DUF497 family protein
MAMEFEWDEAKNEWTRRERGFGFDKAALIFDGPVQTAIDDRRDYGEERLIAIGEVDGDALVVVYTDRGNVRRIISARRANRKERETWQSFAGR